MNRAHRPLLRRRYAALAATTLLVSTTDGLADWPMARHDTSRTGAATSHSDLQSPTIAWRRYMGGSLTDTQATAADVNRDGIVDVVLISGGKLVAKRSDDVLVWETPPLGLFRIDAIRDVNNDGTLDIVASGDRGLVGIFSGVDGHLEWRTNPLSFGPSIGAVRFGRFNADALDDLYVADRAGGTTDNMGDTVYAYSFAQGFGTGFDDGAQRLWQLEQGRDYLSGVNDVVADLDGDGTSEIITFGTRYMYLFNGRDGHKVMAGLADTNGGYPLGFPIPFGGAVADVIDVDGDGRLEIVGYTNNTAAAANNSRAVFVASYDPAAAPAMRLRVRWFRNVADVVADTHVFAHNSAADFDGDGHAEIATSFIEGGVRTTRVLDGATGNERAHIDGTTVIGVVTLAPGEHPTLLVRRGTALEGYRFASFVSSVAPTPAFTIPQGVPANYYDRTRAAREPANRIAITLPIGSTGRQGLLLTEADTMTLWDTTGASPTQVASLPFGAGLSLLSLAPETGVAAPGAGLLFARSDGYLLVVDAAMRVINFGDSGDVTLPGIRTGGFYSGSGALTAIPTAGHFAGASDDVLAQDSRGTLLRIDASRATITNPPADVWSWDGAGQPLLLDTNNDGTRDLVVALESGAIVGRRPDGTTETFRVPVLGPRQAFIGDFVPLRAAGGTRYAAAILDGNNGNGQVVAVNTTGVAWRSTPISVASSGYGHIAVDDLDGDGTDDPITPQQSTLHFFSGATGAELATGLPSFPRMPINVRGRAGAVTTIAAGTVRTPMGGTIARPPTSVTTAWSFPTGFAATNVYGAVIDCPTGLVFATPRYGGPHLVAASAATGAMRYDIALAGGRLFADDIAVSAANVSPGILGNVTATPQLFGSQHALLVGSTDGYLYAVDACATTPQLLWSINFRSPVGEAVFADTDGDGSDEIVVEAADGFLYGVDTQVIAPPAWVYDTNFERGLTTDDIDETRGSEISATWAEVPGATGYEWAVFTQAGTPISRNPTEPANPFLRTDANTRVAHFFEGIVTDHRYFFAVRALSANGASPEALSDGTLFIREISGTDAGMGTDASMMADASSDVVSPTTDVATDGGGEHPAAGCGCRVPGGSERREDGRNIALLACVAASAIAVSRRRMRSKR